jgi:threonine/homoserine/homoserine lactone efflux protein
MGAHSDAMDIVLFFKGIIAGFVIAAPVGPVGILCAQRTLQRGIAHGVVAGMGAAAADTIFGALAAFGLTFIAEFLLSNEDYLRLAGGFLLFAIGVHSLVKKIKLESAPPTITGTAGDLLSTFILTITNPITILTFSPVFLFLGAVVSDGDLAGAWTLIAGVFGGSILWWVMLCTLTGSFRRKMTDNSLRVISRVSGGLIIFFSALVLFSLTDVGHRWFGTPSLGTQQAVPGSGKAGT